MKNTAKQQYLHYRNQLRNLIIKPIAKSAAKEESISKEQEKKISSQLTHDMTKGLDEYLALIQEAIRLLQIEGKLPTSFLDGTTQELIHNETWLQEGKVLQEVLGITNDEIITIYALAKEYYDRTAYHEAEALFMLMVEINPAIAIGWQGLGMCYEHKQQYKEAASLYMMAAELDDHNFAPYLWAADCLRNSGQDQERKHLLEHAIERCKGHPEHNLFKDKAKNLLKAGR